MAKRQASDDNSDFESNETSDIDDVSEETHRMSSSDSDESSVLSSESEGNDISD